MVGRLKFLAIAVGTVLGTATSVAACGSSGNNSSSGPGCTPGVSQACVCTNAQMGAQVCNPDGKSFGMCQCAGGSTGSGGMTTTTSLSGTGGGMACQCTNPGGETYCGAAVCNDAGSGTGGGACASKVTFAGPVMGTTFGSNWLYMSTPGIAGGDQACKDMGADHVCDYDDLVYAASKGELKNLTATDTAWLNRTHSVTITATSPSIEVLKQPATMGSTYKVSKGSRCADWTYSTDHLNDGEFVSFEKGGNSPTFHFDDNPCAIQTVPKDIPCGHNTMPRTVLCCYPKDATCNPPVTDSTCVCTNGVCQ